MRFEPKSEKEIAEANLWQPGVYGFEVTDAKDAVSAKGNEMIMLDLTVYDADGNGRGIRDYLMEAMPAKLRHAADVCGLIQQYEVGNLAAADFAGKTGNLKLKIEKDKTGQYANKNAVADYVVPKIKGEAAQKVADGLDDDIPF